MSIPGQLSTPQCLCLEKIVVRDLTGQSAGPVRMNEDQKLRGNEGTSLWVQLQEILSLLGRSTGDPVPRRVGFLRPCPAWIYWASLDNGV